MKKSNSEPIRYNKQELGAALPMVLLMTFAARSRRSSQGISSAEFSNFSDDIISKRCCGRAAIRSRFAGWRRSCRRLRRGEVAA